jgi:hypothetical protein
MEGRWDRYRDGHREERRDLERRDRQIFKEFKKINFHTLASFNIINSKIKIVSSTWNLQSQNEPGTWNLGLWNLKPEILEALQTIEQYNI